MKRLLLLNVALIISFVLEAQGTLISSDILNTIGTNFTQRLVSQLEPGSPGLNQIWDYSELQTLATSDIEISENGSSNPGAVYPDANQFWSINQGEYFLYLGLTETSFDNYGSFGGDDFQLFYTDPITYLQFPASYELAFVDSFYATYSSDITVGNVRGNYETVVTGHGTLILPWGTLENVYMVHSEVSQIEQFSSNNDTTTAFYNGISINWYAAGFPAPILTINDGVIEIPELNVKEPQGSSIYLADFDFLSVEEKKIVTDLQIFPNPATDVINISFSLEVPQNVSVELLDVRGRKLIQESNVNAHAGAVNYSIEINDIPAGFYLLRLSSAEGVQSRKVVVK